jgi:atrial natriuretic peptide-converting enzyme
LPKDCIVDVLEIQDKDKKKESTQFTLTNNARRHSSDSQPQTELDAPRVKERKPPNCLALAPPPIPKRTFQGKLVKVKDIAATLPIAKIPKQQSRSVSDADNKLDCPNELCSISFDDIGDSDDLVIYDKKSQLIDPNQSSSDSSRSQTTIDTGYISAFETDRSSVTTHQRQFRGRFSSEDTQSSLDSFMSSDLQRADTIESLQSNFTDSPFMLKKNVNVFNFDQNRLNTKISSSGSIDSDNNRSITPIKTHAMRRLPAVPARKGKFRTPPVPPLRKAHQLAESSKKIDKVFFFKNRY